MLGHTFALEVISEGNQLNVVWMGLTQHLGIASGKRYHHIYICLAKSLHPKARNLSHGNVILPTSCLPKTLVASSVIAHAESKMAGTAPLLCNGTVNRDSILQSGIWVYLHAHAPFEKANSKCTCSNMTARDAWLVKTRPIL